MEVEEPAWKADEGRDEASGSMEVEEPVCEVDEDGSILLMLRRLETMSSVLSIKTPSPASQQFGYLSQQKLPFA